MVQIYIKHTDDNYYLLDIEESEVINFKLTVKDLADISKIYSPFTQSFTLPATDKNKILCGFIGNEKIQRVNNQGKFNAKVYISGFLFQSGVLTFEESDYLKKEQKSFKTTFASNLTNLNAILGDGTIQDLFIDEDGAFDPVVYLEWNTTTLRDRLMSGISTPFSNGIPFKYAIPFLSINRVWLYDLNELDTADNIAYTVSSSNSSSRILLGEVRPCINYEAILRHLILKIGAPVICPLLDRSDLKDLFVWCSSESLTSSSENSYPLTNYAPIVYTSGGAYPPTARWLITGGGVTGIFNVQRNNSAVFHENWGDGFNITVTVNDLVSLDNNPTSFKIVLKNANNGAIIDSKTIDGTNIYTYFLSDPLGGSTILDGSGEIDIKVEILPLTFIDWSSIEFTTDQQFYRAVFNGSGFDVTFTKFRATALNTTDASVLGGSTLNLITSLPKIKSTDFLISFFRTFNISVVSTGLPDGSMYWLTPEDIAETNKPYSKRIVDYTKYVDSEVLNKKRGSEYSAYIFKHFDSKYYEAKYGNGVAFGSLQYPEVLPDDATKYEITTSYSLLKQSATFVHPLSIKTCLAFSTDPPSVLENGSTVYTPVFDEFTIFYLKQKSIESARLGSEKINTSNNQIYRVMETSFKNPTTGNTLAFGAEGADTLSLYYNYYRAFIELLLTPNTYKSEFNLTLPPNEIFLNFSNINQGESEIPTGFRPQNEVIIGEQRYMMIDSAINLTTGKSKLTLLNY